MLRDGRTFYGIKLNGISSIITKQKKILRYWLASKIILILIVCDIYRVGR